MGNKKEITAWERGLIPTVILLIAMIVFLCVSCCPKIIERVETQIEYRDRIVHDTATFEIPVEVEKIVTRDTSSHLENRWAKSDALVSDGFLTHSLESIPQVIEVPVEVKVTDTLWRESEVIERVKEVKVEKPLSWWKSMKLDLFPWVFLCLILSLAWIFRKPLLAVIKRLLKF